MTLYQDMDLKRLLLKILLPLLVLALGISGSWLLIKHKTEADEAKVKKVKHEPPLVSVTTAKAETLRMDVASQGVVLPRIEIELVTEVSGKVIKAHPNFAPGGHVKKGETLFAIDSRDYEFAVIRAHAAVAEAYKELLREREEALQASEEWQALGSGKATDYVLHKPQLKEREAKLAAAQTDLAAAKLQLERCRLLAPFTGWIRDQRVLAGQYLTAGVKIARFYADDSAEVRLPIAPGDLAFLNLPNAYQPISQRPSVEFTTHLGQHDQHWQGHLVRTASDLDENSAQAYVIAEIPNAFRAKSGDIPLIPGTFIHASIAGIERFDLLSLPKKALFSGNQVYSVDNNGQLKLHQVELLRNDQNRIIVSKGISNGDRIMVGGIDLPVAGMRVAIKPTEAKPSLNSSVAENGKE